MYTVVARFLLVVGMNSAARNNDNVCAVLNVKVVIDQIVHAAAGNAGGNVHGFFLCARTYLNDYARIIGLVFYFNVFRGLSACAAAVLAYIIGSLERYNVPVGDHSQKLFSNAVHIRNPPFPVQFCRGGIFPRSCFL